MIPVYPVLPTTYVDRGDTTRCLALPMPGERVDDLSLVRADNTIYPVIMSMSQLCKWWHNVREWELSVNHTIWGTQSATMVLNETDTTDEELTLDLPTGWTNATSADPLDWFRAGRWTGNFVWNDGAVDHTAYFTLLILQKTLATVARSYYLTGDFTQILPYFRLTCEGIGVDGNAWAADSAGFYDSSHTVQGSASASVDGVVPVMTAAFDTGSGFETDPMSISLSPSLYWEYRDADGTNPKYNSATGVKL